MLERSRKNYQEALHFMKGIIEDMENSIEEAEKFLEDPKILDNSDDYFSHLYEVDVESKLDSVELHLLRLRYEMQRLWKEYRFIVQHYPLQK